MILFPNCKINLGLRITGKRTDGFHNIETVFYPLPLKDAAELTRNPATTAQPFQLVISGLNIPGQASGNLCTKAFELIKKDFPEIGPLRLHLLKAIPVGAGLGGGSSDGATTLLLLNQELGLGLSTEQLIDYALLLGSDCPFFIINKPRFATGRGEQMEEVELDLAGYYFILINPEVHISTAWAFENLSADDIAHGSSPALIVGKPVSAWRELLVNDFEGPVFREYTSLKMIRDELYAAGAVYASMTGTGSCVYGIFDNKTEPQLQKITDHYKVHNLKQHR